METGGPGVPAPASAPLDECTEEARGCELTQNRQGEVKESAVHAKLIRRIVPFLFVCYVISYLDRVNVGFAALTMNKDIGLTPTAFGIGAGLFFFRVFHC